MRLVSQKRCLDLGVAALRVHLAAQYSRYGSRILLGGSCRGSDTEYFVEARLGEDIPDELRGRTRTGDSSQPAPPLLAICVVDRATGDHKIYSSYEERV